jgi:hypothetical protein
MRLPRERCLDQTRSKGVVSIVSFSPRRSFLRFVLTLPLGDLAGYTQRTRPAVHHFARTFLKVTPAVMNSVFGVSAKSRETLEVGLDLNKVRDRSEPFDQQVS